MDLSLIEAGIFAGIIGFIIYSIRKMQQVEIEMSRMRGEVDMFIKTPVLRQYVEKTVPILMTSDQEKELKLKMIERQREWEQSLGEPVRSEFAEAQREREHKYPSREGIFTQNFKTSPERLV